MGNQALTYLCAKAIALEFGAELRTPSWIGQKVWQLNDPPIQERADVMSTEDNLVPAANGVVDFRSYAQNQTAADFYSRHEVKEWLRWRPEILNLIHQENIATPCVVIHLRRGDYRNSAYPLISKQCAVDFLKGIGEDYYNIISDDLPTVSGKFTGDVSWLPDFWKLVNAEILLRGNSSFSYVAALLASESQTVYSPRIDGKAGGAEVDCAWEAGNHCRLADLPFITDMHVRP